MVEIKSCGSLQNSAVVQLRILWNQLKVSHISSEPKREDVFTRQLGALFAGEWHH